MKNRYGFISLLFWVIGFNAIAQTIPVGTPVIEEYLRREQLLGNFDSTFSFTFRPINTATLKEIDNQNVIDNLYKNIWSSKKLNAKLKLLPIEFRTSFDSHHPYDRNDGLMIRSKGLQTYVSSGIYGEIGPLSVQFKPEYVFAQNLDYPGFPEGFDDNKWRQRYIWYNRIDMPERYGDSGYSKAWWGQSSVRLNKWGMSLGISSENLWWGPSRRNSIMMSNNAQGFAHITFNTTKPIKTPIGHFEWQIVSGRLEASGYYPPDTARLDRGRSIYVPKANDWRYYQSFSATYSPKWIPGLSLGAIRWVQAYSEYIEANNDYFPAFSNLFRDNDGERNETLRDQAAGLFVRWFWKDAKAEIYGEFHRNDASAHFRDLITDSDHTRATTIGIYKLFDTKMKFGGNIEWMWEWTQMEQTGGRILRNSLSWYIHHRVRHGYTNNGEVLGAANGPGGNSHYTSVAWVKGMKRLGFAFERLVHNNDFYRFAFEDSEDFRRYWVDYNFHLFTDWHFKNILASANVFYTRSLNYQWELFHVPYTQPYYVDGTDVGNLHLEFKLAYIFN